MDQQNTTAKEAREAEVKPFPARTEAAPAKKGSRKRLVLGAVALIALGLAGKEGYAYWTVGQYMISTDDAYLKADITAIAPKVQGYVKQIAVQENQKVKAGDVLFRLDDGDYTNALKSAQNQVATQDVTIKRIAAQVKAAEATVGEAQAQKVAAEAGLKNAQLKYNRVEALAKSSVAAQSAVDDAVAALDQARASVTGANAAIAAAQANVSVLQAQGSEAQSQLASLKLAVDQAQRNLDRTVLRAPVDGVVANLAVREGDLVSPGQKIAAVVPTDAIYVEANYKETQIPGIAPGAEVKVTIDALPGKSFTGTVTSLAPATGSEFSLLPPQNATGNFTKVVQRVPVRISLPKALLETGRLRAGLSAVVEVDRRTSPEGK
ncbi:MAG: HlyD family secretion protein [Paracoccaceae bacterium]|nr:HlyD family secretion protein [Paracoccaceae bacterium]MDE3239373.1 HlyD family secretion protein [Paracoccaceae bacterium]